MLEGRSARYLGHENGRQREGNKVYLVNCHRNAVSVVNAGWEFSKAEGQKLGNENSRQREGNKVYIVNCQCYPAGERRLHLLKYLKMVTLALLFAMQILLFSEISFARTLNKTFRNVDEIHVGVDIRASAGLGLDSRFRWKLDNKITIKVTKYISENIDNIEVKNLEYLPINSLSTLHVQIYIYICCEKDGKFFVVGNIESNRNLIEGGKQIYFSYPSPRLLGFIVKNQKKYLPESIFLNIRKYVNKYIIVQINRMSMIDKK